MRPSRRAVCLVDELPNAKVDEEAKQKSDEYVTDLAQDQGNRVDNNFYPQSLVECVRP